MGKNLRDLSYCIGMKGFLKEIVRNISSGILKKKTSTISGSTPGSSRAALEEFEVW
jgi:hypothetical protein